MNIIGIDHGNAQTKTVRFLFASGVAEYEHEPFTSRSVLEYNGKYYVCGTGRQPLTLDKTITETYYLLTLAAVAKEIEARSMPRTCTIIIAARTSSYHLRTGKEQSSCLTWYEEETQFPSVMKESPMK